eukprot:5977336-Prymnesium_polylepis.1
MAVGRGSLRKGIDKISRNVHATFSFVQLFVQLYGTRGDGACQTSKLILRSASGEVYTTPCRSVPFT